MPTSFDKKKKYTYADYLEWPEDERWELIDGAPYNMGPSPSTRHQLVFGALSNQIYNFLSDKECFVLHAPLDVRFFEENKNDDSIMDVVQPDILVVCDPSKLGERGCLGAPDFIVEITSPSTAGRDYVLKSKLYEKNGVKEYWIVHPIDNILHVFLLEGDKYHISVHDGKGELEVATLPGLVIDLDKVFKA
ncbi:MAG: Uma2 family endonuclease [Desulfobacterales bacterium]|nr:Uma2 family endonuclease [Desulfobacterales bacterium]